MYAHIYIIYIATCWEIYECPGSACMCEECVCTRYSSMHIYTFEGMWYIYIYIYMIHVCVHVVCIHVKSTCMYHVCTLVISAMHMYTCDLLVVNLPSFVSLHFTEFYCLNDSNVSDRMASCIVILFFGL
jgi:hypothetical protein